MSTNPANLPNPISDPIGYIYQNWPHEWEVITGAPMSVGVIALLVCIGTWVVFHFLHKRQLDRIPVFEDRIKARDEKIADLEVRVLNSPLPPTEQIAKIQEMTRGIRDSIGLLDRVCHTITADKEHKDVSAEARRSFERIHDLLRETAIVNLKSLISEERKG